MPLDLDDTIAAIASAPGGAARGIVRVSGLQTVDCLAQVFSSADGRPLPQSGPPTICDGNLRLSGALGEIPARLYLWPTNRSYTRQPLAELHTIGSPPLLEAVLAALGRIGARLARPGEFTLRAFLAGRIDLTQAEAVLGVIDAQGQRELDAALSQLAGGLARPLHTLRGDLLDLLAHLEAGLDFADEEIEFISAAELSSQLCSAATAVAAIAAQVNGRNDSSALSRVVLVGEPNAGKSSLFNALAGRDAAIVSHQAGTTRDYVTARLQLGGQQCELVDTAGIEEAPAAQLAAAAQDRTAAQSRQADLTLLCIDRSRPLTEWESTQLTLVPSSSRMIVWTKCDLPHTNPTRERGSPESLAGASGWFVSVANGEGLAPLRQAIFTTLQQAAPESNIVAGTAARCRESLQEAAATLNRARQAANQAHAEDLVAAEIRVALDGLGQVVGAVYTDDVLDRIFSRFCIGK